MKIANKELQYNPLKLVKHSSKKYIHIMAEVDDYKIYFWNSQRKKELITKCKKLQQKNISIFQAILRPIVKQKLLEKVQLAKFELVFYS